MRQFRGKRWPGVQADGGGGGGGGGGDGGGGGSDGDKLDDEARQRVRMYERSKLRWFFAVAEFDSAGTAARVYAECDGHEFEESAITFDLRFVPDAEDFAGREVRAACCVLGGGGSHAGCRSF